MEEKENTNMFEKLSNKNIIINEPIDAIQTISAEEPSERAAINLRNEFFDTDLFSYFRTKVKIHYCELEQAFSNAGITKNYEEFKQILPELKDITIQYDMPMGSYQLKIKQIDLHNYEITKKAFPFPEEMNDPALKDEVSAT